MPGQQQQQQQHQQYMAQQNMQHLNEKCFIIIQKVHTIEKQLDGLH